MNDKSAENMGKGRQQLDEGNYEDLKPAKQVFSANLLPEDPENQAS